MLQTLGVGPETQRSRVQLPLSGNDLRQVVCTSVNKQQAGVSQKAVMLDCSIAGKVTVSQHGAALAMRHKVFAVYPPILVQGRRKGAYIQRIRIWHTIFASVVRVRPGQMSWRDKCRAFAAAIAARHPGESRRPCSDYQVGSSVIAHPAPASAPRHISTARRRSTAAVQVARNETRQRAS